MRTINFEDLYKLKSYILIDARSPKEFQDSPIPGAVNIPALLDEERAEVLPHSPQIIRLLNAYLL